MQGEIKNYIHQNHIFSVRLIDNSIHPEFLSNLIGSQRGKRYFLKVGKQTTGIATVNKTVLSSFPILKPPVELQSEYMKIVKKKTNALKHTNSSTSLLSQLFNSLSQKAFRGEL